MSMMNILHSMTRPELEHLKSLLNLSETESFVFDMLAKGKSIKEISARTDLSERSVNRNIGRIRAKVLEVTGGAFLA